MDSLREIFIQLTMSFTLREIYIAVVMITYVHEKNPILYATPIYISAAITVCKCQWKQNTLTQIDVVKKKERQKGWAGFKGCT